MHLLKKWKKWYEPSEEINVRWYNSLYNKVEIEELEVIRLLPNKKAPDQSGLQYEWFKHLPESESKAFRLKGTAKHQ
ncbi:1114_t:CDS:1, partial [Diversispora eburnea]